MNRVSLGARPSDPIIFPYLDGIQLCGRVPQSRNSICVYETTDTTDLKLQPSTLLYCLFGIVAISHCLTIGRLDFKQDTKPCRLCVFTNRARAAAQFREAIPKFVGHQEESGLGIPSIAKFSGGKRVGLQRLSGRQFDVAFVAHPNRLPTSDHTRRDRH